MFTAALKNARAQLKASGGDDGTIHVTDLPSRYSFARLYDELIGKNEGKLEAMIVLNSCLVDSPRLVREQDEGTIVEKLRLWISEAVLPGPELFEERSLGPSSEAIILAQKLGTLGLNSLLQLTTFYPNSALSDKAIFSVLAYTSLDDPWTTSRASATAAMLVSIEGDHVTSSQFVISFLLQSFIRPLFSVSRPSTITAAGRKAIETSGPRKQYSVQEAERSARSWTIEKPYSITVLGWAVQAASSDIITHNFHLFVPPILTLLDDISTEVKGRGLKILSCFLPKLTSTRLSETGLASVFEDAVVPLFSYLPSLTPIEESMKMLPPAYEAMFVLGDVLFPSDESKSQIQDSSTSSSKPHASQRQDTKPIFLTRLLRHSLLPSFTHISTGSQYPQLNALLFTNLTLLIFNLGIYTVKHLKDILPLLSTVLCDPFIPSQPELLKAALRCMQTIITICWPRLGEERHWNEIVKSLVLCWKSLQQVDENTSASVVKEMREEVKITGRLLVAAVEGSGAISRAGFEGELGPLVSADESIGDVFGMGEE